jgi:hypothetical protein
MAFLDLRTRLCEWFGRGRKCNSSLSNGVSYDYVHHGADPLEKLLVFELV